MRVAFLTKDLQLSGGVGVVLTHARNLATGHGFDVSLVTTAGQPEADWDYADLAHLNVASLADARSEQFDLAISSWWETAYALFDLKATRYASFVQSLEDRFYRPHESLERLSARLTLELPVAFITEAAWIAETLAELRPGVPVHLVRNGIDKAAFAPLDTITPNNDAPLRVLIEGSPESWFKGVDAAINSVNAMREPHTVQLVCPTRGGLAPEDARRAVGPLTTQELAAVYSDTDVLVKLSRVEGMYGPPLEGFHRGATCVTTEVTGHDEYIRHGVNGLIVDWDDEHGTAAQLDMLARDRKLLLRLRQGALDTAKGWPDWSQSSARFAEALNEIEASQLPSPYAGMAAMLARINTGLEAERGTSGYYRLLRADAARWQRINSLPGIRHFFAARRALKRSISRSHSS